MPGIDAAQRFPFINLEKAVERAKQLYDADQRGNEMAVPAAFAVWEYSEKSSGGFQTIAALKSYGLLAEGDSADIRKVKLSKAGLDYFRDEREEPRAKLLQDFATQPQMLRTLWNLWGATPPADAVARSHLKIERGLNEQSARALLNLYKDNLSFATLTGHAKIGELDLDTGSKKFPWEEVKVGEYVQWTSDGIDQFKPVRKVIKVDDGHVWVFGSNTGIPVEQVKVAPAPTPTPVMKANKSIVIDPTAPDNDPPEDAHQIDVLLRGGRLQITADVDAAGLAKLKDVLAKYEEILKLLEEKPVLPR